MNKKIKHIKPNKKGSSLFLVIVSLAIVSIFAAISLLMSFGGYIAKHKDTRSDKNFYTLEERLDKIYMDIGMTANDIFVKQYQQIRNELSILPPDDINPRYLELCMAAFEKQEGFKDLSAFWNEAVDGENGFKLSINKEKTGIDPKNARCYVFKDVHIEYTSGLKQSQPPVGEGDTFNSVTTDIVITIPMINITAEMNYDAKHEYIYITDGNITLKGSASNVHEAVGNIYCGNSMLIGQNGYKDVTIRSDYLTVYNTIALKNGSLNIYGSSSTAEIWARDIKVDKQSNGTGLTIIGNTFTADDLEINGSYSSVSLFGTYTGFGKENGAKGDNDSSIAVNGKGTTLDLSGITKLIIGGNAYFPLSYNNGTQSSEQLKTGEALALIVNENLYQVYSGYVHQNSNAGGNNIAYVDNIKTGGKITFDKITDSAGKTLATYLSEGYTLVSTGVNITSYSNGLGMSGQQFFNGYLKDVEIPIKLATYSKNGGKYCYLFWDFVNDEKRDEFVSKCIEKGLEEKFLTNFLDLGQIIVNKTSDIYAETDLYAYKPAGDAYKAELAKGNATKLLPEYITSYLTDKKNQFAQYNKSLAPVTVKIDNSNVVLTPNTENVPAIEGTLAAAGTSNKIVSKYINETTIKSNSTTYIPEGKLLIVDGDLRISNGNVTVTDSTNLVTKPDDTDVAMSAISQMNGYGMIIVTGSFVSDSSVIDKFGGMIIAYKAIEISGGTYVYDSRVVVNAIRTTKSETAGYESDWGNLFTEEFYNDITAGKQSETSFKITDFMKYENWMKNKNV